MWEIHMLEIHMLEEIDMYVTNDKLINASVRCGLDPFYKNVLQRKNPYDSVFKGISKFDGQN